MLGSIRRAISILRRKRILHKLGVVISVTVIAAAFYVLFHILRDIDVEEVIEAVKRTEWHSIALSGLFVAAGYFTLTFYDLFAVRTIGITHVPYRVTAFAAFTSYSIGHNVGASIFTGGAVRYRIYSAWGMNAISRKSAFWRVSPSGSATPPCSDWALPITPRRPPASISFRRGSIG